MTENIDYKVRYSKRAKYLKIAVTKAGVEVIVPNKIRVSAKTIQDFILEKKTWIMKNLEYFSKHGSEDLDIKDLLPEKINLLAIEKAYDIFYIPTVSKKIKLLTNQNLQIKLLGDLKSPIACIKLLKAWLKQTANEYLLQLLKEISSETGLTYAKSCIRDNTTRWGSCSSEKSISLCCKLLFLPPNLARHVILHELCHTKHMNHGVRFWRLLEKYDQNAKVHAAQLSKISQDLPAWALKVL